MHVYISIPILSGILIVIQLHNCIYIYDDTVYMYVYIYIHLNVFWCLTTNLLTVWSTILIGSWCIMFSYVAERFFQGLHCCLQSPPCGLVEGKYSTLLDCPKEMVGSLFWKSLLVLHIFLVTLICHEDITSIIMVRLVAFSSRKTWPVALFCSAADSKQLHARSCAGGIWHLRHLQYIIYHFFKWCN